MANRLKKEHKKIRWVSVDNFDTRTTLQLLVSHNVAPLAAKSVLNLWNQQINITEYVNHTLIILPCIRLSRRSMKSFTNYKKWEKLGERLKQAKRLGKEGVIRENSSWYKDLLSTTQTVMDKLRGKESKNDDAYFFE